MKTIIKTDKLCKSYVIGKTPLNVIKNLDMEIYEGDFTVIMGASGSGKSTLLYSLSTMDKITSGNVFINDKDISQLNEKGLCEIRKNDLSFIFQSVNLFPDMTAFENIAYTGYNKNPIKKEVDDKAMKLLAKFSLSDDKDKYPSELSGGQQQRVAIARALISDAKIIFADEPTGALNSSTGNEVLNALTSINEEGVSIVMVTHDFKAAARATRLLYLTDGRISGELKLDKYSEDKLEEREKEVYEFLRSHNW